MKEEKNLDDLDIETTIKLKNVLLSKKQGEALERCSNSGNTPEETIGLGFFGPPTVIAIVFIKSYEEQVNSFAGITDTPLSELADNVARASGSRSAKRLEKSLETVGQLGQFMPFQGPGLPTPQAVEFSE